MGPGDNLPGVGHGETRKGPVGLLDPLQYSGQALVGNGNARKEECYYRKYDQSFYHVILPFSHGHPVAGPHPRGLQSLAVP